jgi:uncharacterized membrane protein YfcA
LITDPLLWVFAALGAFMVGVSKAGITGLSILSIALFNHVFPSSKQASGLVLPLLIFGDFVAVFSYRKHTQWHFLWRLFPWTAAGVVIGYFTLGRISDHSARILVGWIIISLAALSFWRKYMTKAEEAGAPQFHWSVGAGIGITAGFITLVANAAGPLMALYLVAMRLPKMEYVGTAAVFFLLLNLFKVPFMVDLGGKMMYQGGLWGLIVLVADVWAIVNIFQSGADTGNKVVWTVVVIVLPVLGFILWYIWGPKTSKA